MITEESESELRAVQGAREWAKAQYRAALSQPALGKPWTAYCRAFDHELWVALTRIHGVWT